MPYCLIVKSVILLEVRALLPVFRLGSRDMDLKTVYTCIAVIHVNDDRYICACAYIYMYICTALSSL